MIGRLASRWIARTVVALGVLAGAVVFTPLRAHAQDDSTVFTDTPTLVMWDDLLPDGENERLDEMYANLAALASAIDEGEAGDEMSQIGTTNVVEELDGEFVRIPGFLLPLDYLPGGKASQFLIVPYYGACIHTPPPPPNQMVYMETDEPVESIDLWAAFWVEGVLSVDTRAHDYGEAAYSIEMSRMEPYE